MTRRHETRADYFAARLAEVWVSSDTARTLGHKLGMTRGAVTGHYNRNRALKVKYPLSGDRNPAKPAKEARRLPFDVEHRLVGRRKLQEGTKERRKASAAPDTGKGRYTLLALPACGCHWPFGDTGSFTFCGEAIRGSGPYCAPHAERAGRGYAL